MLRRLLLALAGALGIAAGGLARADMAGPTEAPVDRLVANLTKAVDDKPDDADAHYRLARAHTMAFALGATSLRVFEHGSGTPEVANLEFQDKSPRKPLTAEARNTHVAQAVLHFDRAIQINPDRAQYYLGLGWLLESAKDLGGEIGVNPTPSHAAAPDGVSKNDQSEIASLPNEKTERRLRSRLGLECTGLSSFLLVHPGGPPLVDALIAARNDPDPARRKIIVDILTQYWEIQAEHRYFQAFARSLDAEAYNAVQPTFNGIRSGINYEAAESYLRLVNKRGPTKCDGVRYATAQAAIKAYDKLPLTGAVSPIIFPTRGPSPLASIIDADASVKFDLDGTGREQTYCWVRPDTGVLVWNPSSSGKITSGRQFFGSVTWWIFFDNGYQALDALDDNRDGELTGDELKGIAVWIDRNGNGVSDPGEVVPVESFGIRAIRVHATSTEDGCPADREGLVMADGRVLPTYDWIAAPAAPNSKPPVMSAAK
jgi:hypothetical protein